MASSLRWVSQRREYALFCFSPNRVANLSSRQRGTWIKQTDSFNFYPPSVIFIRIFDAPTFSASIYSDLARVTGSSRNPTWDKLWKKMFEYSCKIIKILRSKNFNLQSIYFVWLKSLFHFLHFVIHHFFFSRYIL